MNDTTINYHTASLQATVLEQATWQDKTIIITNQTPFHPVSHTWPDQPADHGTLEAEGKTYNIVTSILGATSGEQLLFDKEIPVKLGTKGWTFFVCHVIEEEVDLLKKEVILTINEEFRNALSKCHSACHLAALALNIVLKTYWKKDVLADPLGNPNFDNLAMDVSKITTECSIDRYRVGKSIKKKGFDRVRFHENFSTIAQKINEQLEVWRNTGADIQSTADNKTINSRRYWELTLPEGHVKFPCGGTHAKSLKEYKKIHVTLAKGEEPQVIMKTFVD